MLRIDTVRPGFMARIPSLNLRREVTETDIAAIRAAFATHPVLVLPDQAIDGAAQVAVRAGTYRAVPIPPSTQISWPVT